MLWETTPHSIHWSKSNSQHCFLTMLMTLDIIVESKWVKMGVCSMSFIMHSRHILWQGWMCVPMSMEDRICPPLMCGDHMATSTFNGAIESGVNA